MSNTSAVNSACQILRVAAIAAVLACALAALTGSYTAGYSDGHRDASEWYVHQDVLKRPFSFKEIKTGR